MPVRSDVRQIPIVRGAVEMSLLHCEAAGKKSLRDHISVLRGAEGRVVGRAAAGSAVAQSQLGELRVDRVGAEDLIRWFLSRVPTSLAPATRKKCGSNGPRG
jgi:hypothetical protein